MTSQSQATPLTPAALLLRGLVAPGGRGCLPCDPSVRAALEELRAALVPAHFPLERLQARARALLQGREGRFFRDYALSAFVGRAEVDGLQGVASFLKNRTQDSLMSSLTDGPLLEKLVNVREQVIKEFKKVLRSCELKELLKEEVLDCLHCQKTSPKGVKAKCCFALEFEMIGKRPRTQRLVGIFMVVFPALFFFLVILISTYMDWLRTQKPLMSMAEPNQANDWQEV